jgi:hypothetical protein
MMTYIRQNMLELQNINQLSEQCICWLTVYTEFCVLCQHTQKLAIIGASDTVLSLQTEMCANIQILFNISPEDWELPVKSPPAGV